MTIKKLYRVQFAKQTHVDGVFNIEDTRAIEVAAVDASQAVRKVKYNLTRQKLHVPTEFIDSVTRVGIIEIK